jgi:hypothetical protein
LVTIESSKGDMETTPLSAASAGQVVKGAAQPPKQNAKADYGTHGEKCTSVAGDAIGHASEQQQGTEYARDNVEKPHAGIMAFCRPDFKAAAEHGDAVAVASALTAPRRIAGESDSDFFARVVGAYQDAKAILEAEPSKAADLVAAAEQMPPAWRLPPGGASGR